METYETSLMRRLFNYDHLLGRQPRLAPLGHLVHIADSALGRWFQEMMSNQFKPDHTGFGLLCVCVCVCVRLFVCWTRLFCVIGCLPHVCVSLGARLCFAWSCVSFV